MLSFIRNSYFSKRYWISVITTKLGEYNMMQILQSHKRFRKHNVVKCQLQNIWKVKSSFHNFYININEDVNTNKLYRLVSKSEQYRQ